MQKEGIKEVLRKENPIYIPIFKCCLGQIERQQRQRGDKKALLAVRQKEIWTVDKGNLQLAGVDFNDELAEKFAAGRDDLIPIRGIKGKLETFHKKHGFLSVEIKSNKWTDFSLPGELEGIKRAVDELMLEKRKEIEKALDKEREKGNTREKAVIDRFLRAGILAGKSWRERILGQSLIEDKENVDFREGAPEEWGKEWNSHIRSKIMYTSFECLIPRAALELLQFVDLSIENEKEVWLIEAKAEAKPGWIREALGQLMTAKLIYTREHPQEERELRTGIILGKIQDHDLNKETLPIVESFKRLYQQLGTVVWLEGRDF